jgi:glucosamine kinase
VPRYYLGVDGGGTNCRIRLADENLQTLADASGGRSNLQIEAGDPAYRSILEGTRDAFAKAGIDYAETANTYACFGMAGGWGFHIGDQMSGAILGRELVRYTVEADDGLCETSPLTDAVIERLGGSIDAVMDWSFPQDPRGPMPATEGAPSTLLGRAPAEYGALVPMFFDFYEQGDPVAKKLMAIELGYIDSYVNWFKSRGVTRMAAVGGFGTRLYPLLIERYGDFIVRPVDEPLHGAVILARQNFA